MFGLSASHLLIIAVILLIFGAKKLPEFGAGLGKGLRAFKSALEGQDQPNPAQLADKAKEDSLNKETEVKV